MTSVLMYSHDTVGLGHARRNRALAYALAQELPELTGEPVGGLLIAGSPNAARDPLPEGWDWFILPGITHGPEGHTPRHLDAPMDVVRQLRSLALSAAAATFEPDLFIVDRHPWGIDYELEDALYQARMRGSATVLGLRDVLDEPDRVASEWDRLEMCPELLRHSMRSGFMATLQCTMRAPPVNYLTYLPRRRGPRDISLTDGLSIVAHQQERLMS